MKVKNKKDNPSKNFQNQTVLFFLGSKIDSVTKDFKIKLYIVHEWIQNRRKISRE
jgi:hypothetical protein